LWPSLDDAALRLGDETVTYGELVVIGSSTGLLDEARAGTTQATRVLKANPDAIGDDDLRREAEAFRRQRRLHSGDDLRSWLERRALDEADWREHLRRSVALQSQLEPFAGSIADDEVEGALVVDLACSGWWSRVADEAVRLWSAERALRRRGSHPPEEARAQNTDDGDGIGASFEEMAKRIAECVPSLGTLDVEWCADRLRALESRRQDLADVVDACSEPDAVARQIRERAVDWTAFVYDEIVLPNLTFANEALMCARDDGLPPGDIAARARVPLERRDRRRDQISTGIAAMLTGAVVGDALGPFDEDDGVHVIWLHDRRVPSPDVPKLREAAIAELVSERLDRAAAGKALVVGLL
jgi:hypothetical protein